MKNVNEKITLRHEQINTSKQRIFAESKNRIGDIVESPFSNLCSKISESERNGELEMRERKRTMNYPRIHYSDKLVLPTILK